MKKKLFIISLCLLATACGKEEKFNEYDIPKDINIKVSKIAREVFQPLMVKDLIIDSNVKVQNEDEYLNTSTLGDHIYKMSFIYNDKKYKYDIKYTIIDDQAPIMISSPNEVTLDINSDKNPCDSFVFVDNYDSTPTCTIEGEYDISKIDNYNLKAIISDSNENKLEKSFTLKVKEPIKKQTSTSSTAPVSKNRLPIANVINKYKNENTMIGIDVSKWQGYIDYNKVKEAGVEFVIMRLGTQTDTLNEISVDTYYYQNIKAAKEAGLKVGVYVANTANTTELSKKEAKWTAEILNGVELDFPVAFDFERWTIFRTFKMSLNDLKNVYYEFANTLKNEGYDTMLYGSKWYLENIWPMSNDVPVWLAHYTSQTNYTGKYLMWQLSNTGNVPGINTDVDIDIYYINK